MGKYSTYSAAGQMFYRRKSKKIGNVLNFEKLVYKVICGKFHNKQNIPWPVGFVNRKTRFISNRLARA